MKILTKLYSHQALGARAPNWLMITLTEEALGHLQQVATQVALTANSPVPLLQAIPDHTSLAMSMSVLEDIGYEEASDPRLIKVECSGLHPVQGDESVDTDLDLVLQQIVVYPEGFFFRCSERGSWHSIWSNGISFKEIQKAAAKDAGVPMVLIDTETVDETVLEWLAARATGWTDSNDLSEHLDPEEGLDRFSWQMEKGGETKFLLELDFVANHDGVDLMANKLDIKVVAGPGDNLAFNAHVTPFEEMPHYFFRAFGPTERIAILRCIAKWRFGQTTYAPAAFLK